MKKLKQMPMPFAIAIMVLCILVGITFGNGNALKKAVAASDTYFEEVLTAAGQYAGKAYNYRDLGSANNVSQATLEALEKATSAVQEAKTPEALSKANQSLAEAVSGVEAALLEHMDSNDRLLVAARDELTSAQGQMNRKIRAYNESQQGALDVYSKLPMKFLLGRPEVIA